MAMDSRERVFTALDHREPDRVPRDLWATKETVAKLLSRLGLPDAEALWDRFDIDLRYIEGPRYIGPPFESHSDGSENDIWGVPRITEVAGEGDRRQSYRAVTRFPLSAAASPADLDRYAYWPDPDWYDYSVVREQALAVREKGRVSVFMGDRLNRIAQLKPAMYLRGIEQALLDMVAEPEIFHAVVGRISAFYNEYAARILEAARGAIDIVCTGDDFGQQYGTLCSVPMWRELLRPGFARYLEILHQGGVRTMHHTCGSIYALLPDFIECRLDILQALQPYTAHMDYRGIKTEFGGRISFQGAISIQRALPFGTPDDVRQEVKERMEALAPGGGYIVSTSHNIQGDTPVENVLALFEAYEAYGGYR